MTEKWMRIRGWLIGVSCGSLILGIVMVDWSQISATVLCWSLGLLSIYNSIQSFSDVACLTKAIKASGIPTVVDVEWTPIK